MTGIAHSFNLREKYPDVASLRRARDEDLGPARAAVERSKARIDELDQERERLAREREFYPKGPMPADLQRRIDQNNAVVAAQTQVLKKSQEDVARVAANFDELEATMKRLWVSRPTPMPTMDCSADVLFGRSVSPAPRQRCRPAVAAGASPPTAGRAPVCAASASIRAGCRRPVASGLRRAGPVDTVAALAQESHMNGRTQFRSHTMFWAIASIALLSLAVTVSAHAATDAAFAAAFGSFAKAAAGDDASIDAAATAFESLRTAEPANPVVVAYAGASATMRAKTALAPFDKMSRAEDGLALLDKSLAMLTPAHDAPIERGTPGSLEVRFVAANTFLGVPSFMNRGAKGRRLLDDVLASPLFAHAPLPFRGTVWLRAGELAAKDRRADDARRYLNEIVSRNAPQAERARTLLKELA